MRFIKYTLIFLSFNLPFAFDISGEKVLFFKAPVSEVQHRTIIKKFLPIWKKTLPIQQRKYYKKIYENSYVMIVSRDLTWEIHVFQPNTRPPSFVKGKNNEIIFKISTNINLDKSTLKKAGIEEWANVWWRQNVTDQLHRNKVQELFNAAEKSFTDSQAEAWLKTQEITPSKYRPYRVYEMTLHPNLYSVEFQVQDVSPGWVCVGNCYFDVYLKKDTLEWVAISR